MADMWRVTTTIGGPYVVGGGVQQFYFDLGGGTAAQAQTAVKTFWASNLTLFGTGTTFRTEAGVEQVDSENGDIILVSAGTGATVTGTGGTEVLPYATQGLLQWRSGSYSDGRELRGRTFLPAMLETSSTGGIPAGTVTTAFPTAGAALIADANSILVCWRRPRKARPQVGNPGDPWYLRAQTARDGTFAPITTCEFGAQWASLRSRRD